MGGGSLTGQGRPCRGATLFRVEYGCHAQPDMGDDLNPSTRRTS